ncbi:MAG TPA: glycosyltransferase family 2 protein [Acidobacteriaceae bacterium]|nr:glycosyltransferase family 2 protein [Acidobacteriaceae bacterium]
MRTAVILLSFNSEDTLGATLAQARKVASEIFVIDSYSSDGTVALAESYGATVVQHPFENYGAQRNWGIDNLPITAPWQLHLDADEVMDDTLVSAILALPETPQHAGYFVPRYVKFLGRVMRHGGMSPTWHLRLFRTGVGRCEDRKYDQHYLLVGPGTTGQLPGVMIDDIAMSISEWTARHNRWADGEVAELFAEQSGGAETGRLVADSKGNPAQRKRALRQKYNNLPLFVRPFLLFGYRYFFKLGFLDGAEGFIFWTLQTFWFRFLIDSKIWERRNRP